MSDEDKETSEEQAKEAKPKGRLSVIVVLVLCSAMISIGLGALFLATRENEATQRAREDGMIIDDSEPNAVAESFLDAWRKRDHGVAASLSLGDARAAVTERKQREQALDPETLAIKEQVWDPMAASRLVLMVDRSESPTEGVVHIWGEAVGEFLGQPYRRVVAFETKQLGERWRVTSMALGQIVEGADFGAKAKRP